MGARLEHLRKEHTKVTDGISLIERAAITEKRDLTDAEQADVDALYKRAESLAPEIKTEADKAESLSASAAVLARIGGTQGTQLAQRAEADKADALPATLGEVFALAIRAQQGDEEAETLLMRAVDTQTTTDTPGLLPQVIVGPVIKLADSLRPVWNSFTSRPMPTAGKKFTRPRVTQRVLVAEQLTELAELASRNMTITGDEVTKRTFGGVLELSEQDIDWTDPSALQIAIQDFVDYYAEITEGVACTALVALAATTSPWTTTTIATLISSLTTAIGVGFAAAKRVPDTLWLSFDEALELAGNTNSTTNVSAMTLIKAALSDAGISLNVVVGPQLPANTRILGVKALVESYENVKGLIQAPDVSKLGVVMAYRGYAATYGVPAGFVSLTV